jgi:hypothetical protein
MVQEPQTEAVTVHRLPTSRWWMVVGLVMALAVSFQQITQPDYNTKHRATPSEWLWVVVPGLGFAAVLAWRMLRSRVETSPQGVRAVGVFTTEDVAWADLAGVEVRATPNRGGFVVNARRVNRRLTKLGTIPGRSGKRRAQADAFAAAIEAERARHLAGAGV